MTLDWIRRLGIVMTHDEAMTDFRIPGGQRYPEVKCRIPGDFSSATFFLAAGAMGGNDVLCRGLDMADTQGDKAVVDFLADMGANVDITSEGIRVCGRGLKGIEIDLNATPDALPMLASLACFAEGETRLVNVPQARIKETDRIAVMCSELTKMGADVEELSDGIIIRESKLRGTDVESHDDHRIAMALAIAAMQATGETTIHDAQAVAVTYPTFAEALSGLGGRITLA
jgi:3-phosphoshikimate 1-carboxyvinyltransferase